MEGAAEVRIDVGLPVMFGAEPLLARDVEKGPGGARERRKGGDERGKASQSEVRRMIV